MLALPARGLLLSIETKVTKSSLLSTAREVAEIEVSTKLDYRLHRAYNNSSALPPHRTQNPLSKTHTLLCPAISKAKKKTFCPLSDADFFCKEKGFLNSWVYKKQFEQLKGQHKPNLLHQKSASEKKAQALIQNNLKEQLHRVSAYESGFAVE